MVFVDIPDEFASALTNANIDAAGAARELVVAFAGDFRDPKLLRFLSEPRPVLFIGLLNGCPILGPLQRLGQSVCIGCTQYWARASTQSPDPEVQPDPTSGLHLLVGLTRDVISEFNRRGTISGLDRSLQSIHGRTLDRRRHSIVSLRSCRFCRREEEIHVKEHCSPLTGIVNRLRRTSQPVAGVYHSYSSFIVPPGSEAVLSTASRTSWGRGLTAAGAENSCIGEAIEGYSLMHRGDEATVRARLSEIDGIDPRKILLISQRQYERRECSNHTSARHYIPSPVDIDEPIDWLPGTNLTDGRRTWIPAACCLMSYRFRQGESEFARADASGCASGRSQTEAILSALHESIERDALAIWWYNRSKRPQVSLDSAGNECLAYIENEFRLLGRTLTVLDITTDLNVPAYVGVTTELDGSRPVIASAAHLSPRMALRRTLTEVALNWFIASKNPCDEDIREWLKTAVLEQHPHLQAWGLHALPPEPVPMNTQAQVECLTSRLAMAGLHPVAVDLTRDDTLLNTVRVVVPGLRTFKPRYSSGRLYDIPVLLGWRPDPVPESELNPWCVF